MKRCLQFLPLMILQTQLLVAQTVPVEVPPVSTWRLTVDGQPTSIVQVRVSARTPQLRAMTADASRDDLFELAGFALLAGDQPKHVRIELKSTPHQVEVLPKWLNIEPHLSQNGVEFDLPGGRPVTVEIDGEIYRSLELLPAGFSAAPAETRAANLVYYGPGLHHLSEGIVLSDHQTLYLAAGAVLQCETGSTPAITLKGKDIAVMGDGIIDGTKSPLHSRNLIFAEGSDLRITGVTLVNSPGWNCVVRHSDHVTIDQIHIFGYRANSDGIDICNSRDVLVQNCFIRTSDDLIVIKADRGQGAARRVVVRGCTLWNQFAHALSIGAECGDPVSDIWFENCDVLHDVGREWTMRVFQCDAGLIEHVRFDDIRVTRAERLISCWIGQAVWSRDAERGRVNDVSFTQIRCGGALPQVELHGFDAKHGVTNVKLDVSINGQALADTQIRRNAFVDSVTTQKPN